jgi:hypothetical protein
VEHRGKCARQRGITVKQGPYGMLLDNLMAKRAAVGARTRHGIKKDYQTRRAYGHGIRPFTMCDTILFAREGFLAAFVCSVFSPFSSVMRRETTYRDCFATTIYGSLQLDQWRMEFIEVFGHRGIAHLLEKELATPSVGSECLASRRSLDIDVLLP